MKAFFKYNQDLMTKYSDSVHMIRGSISKKILKNNYFSKIIIKVIMLTADIIIFPFKNNNTNISIKTFYIANGD